MAARKRQTRDEAIYGLDDGCGRSPIGRLVAPRAVRDISSSASSFSSIRGGGLIRAGVT